MFEQFSQRMGRVFQGFSGSGKLSEADVDQALREVRLAMLEADVALPVVRQFVAEIREKAVGSDVLEGVSAGQTMARIIHEALTEALGGENVPPLSHEGHPSVYLLAGLQGAGKTTTAGKLAWRLAAQEGRKVLLASLDVQRPAAQLQLERLAQSVGAAIPGGAVAGLSIIPGQTPLEIADRALKEGRAGNYDAVILDTAGRLGIDQALMEELRAVSEQTHPNETLLVVDAMTGQDAVVTAQAFKDIVPLSGVVLTRMDGDARGGAALSMRGAAGVPIKFAGVGEKYDALEVFHPERVAGRILGLGDVAGLVEQVSDRLDQEEGERLAKRMAAGEFDLNDYLSQINQMSKLGSLSGILGMLPGMGKIKEALAEKDLDKQIFQKHRVIISSMTLGERSQPGIIKASRKKRIAAGAGVSVAEVNRLLKQHADMSTMMKRLKKMGIGGMLSSMKNGQGMAGLGDLLKGIGKPPGGFPGFKV